MNKELLNESIEYIILHFDENITTRTVAEHFHFSEAYFCRAFKEEVGVSVYEFIKRLKLNQSAVDIKLMKDRLITDIGLDYGYSASNYSTAFKKQHSVSPVQFRSEIDTNGSDSPFYPESASHFPTFEQYDSDIKISELADIHVIFERVLGNYKDLREKWPQFITKYGKYRTQNTRFIERFYNDPTITNPEECIYDICMSDYMSCPFGEKTIIQGGKHAIYHYEGRIEDIFCYVQGVFCVWLPNSGYCMNGKHGLNIYSEIDANSDYLVMELAIPIKKVKNSEVRQSFF